MPLVEKEKGGGGGGVMADQHKTVHKTIPALSSKERPRDKPNAIENIDQSTNSFQLLWRGLHNIDVHSLSTFVGAKPCLSRLCFPFTLAKWIPRMPNKGKKEKVMYQALCVSFIFPVNALNMVMSTIWQLWQIACSTCSLLFLLVKYQASKSGGSAKQANKENGDVVSDEVRWKFRFWLEKSFRSLSESHQDHDIVYWDGCWLTDFSVWFFSCRQSWSLSPFRILRVKQWSSGNMQMARQLWGRRNGKVRRLSMWATIER